MLQHCGILLVLTITLLLQYVSAVNYGYGVDIFSGDFVSKKAFQCMRNNGYGAASIRIYSPAGSGSIDRNGKDNIMNAIAANLGVETFVQPNPLSSKSGATQFSESQNYYSGQGITISRIWLVVSDPMKWSSNMQSNINFINSFISQARQGRVEVGIYTNWYDWLLITGGYSVQRSGNVLLWYWHTLGQGISAETDPNFSDFRSFSGWQTPAIKQFGIVEAVCGVNVNRDAFVTSADSANENDTKLAAPAFKFGTGVSVTKQAMKETEETVQQANDNEKSPSHLFKEIVEKNQLKH